MAGGMGAQKTNTLWEGGVGTPCLNHLTHGHQSINRCGQDWGTLFRAGKWMHLAWVHDARPEKTAAYHSPSYNLDTLFINGTRCTGQFGAGANDVTNLDVNYSQATNLLRLGERRSAPMLNTVPDSTLDEVLIWEGLTMDTAEARCLEIWKEGRYYQGNDGVFTSRPIDLTKGITDSAITLFLAAWTQYRPDTLPQNATCEVSIVDAETLQPLTETPFLHEPSGSPIKAYGGGPLAVNKKFRYRVFFRPHVTINDPIVDSLIFDDITLIYYAAPVFKSWTSIQ
jgi:hypothetical protein